MDFEEPADVKILDGFKRYGRRQNLKELYDSLKSCYDIQRFPSYPELL